MPGPLAAKVRAKFPGVYDDMDDAALEKAVLAKHPEYADLAEPQAAPAAAQPAAPAPSMLSRAASTVADVGIGAAKGLGNTVVGLGQAVHQIPGVSRGVDALYGSPGISQASMQEADRVLTPTNTAQQVGYGAEQIGEFFVPGAAVAKAGKVAKLGRVAADTGLALAQSGSPTQAGITGVLSAAIPGGSAAKAVGGVLETSARKSMAQALGATKEWAKTEAARLAPEMLKRGIGGSRAVMLDTAKETAKRVGTQLDDAYRLAAEAGETVPSTIVRENLALTANALKVQDAKGVMRVIPGSEGAIQKLDELGAFVASLGDDIPVDKAAHIKRVWDGIVAKGGLFGPKATASATDNATAWATREATGSFRKILNTNPTIAALNAESQFWIGMKNVLKETQKRTQAQGGGLVAAGMGGSGAVVGALSGDSAGDRAQKALIGGVAGAALIKGMQSPWWRTKAAAPLKQGLADALSSGSAARVTSATNRILTALPAQ